MSVKPRPPYILLYRIIIWRGKSELRIWSFLITIEVESKEKCSWVPSCSLTSTLWWVMRFLQTVNCIVSLSASGCWLYKSCIEKHLLWISLLNCSCYQQPCWSGVTCWISECFGILFKSKVMNYELLLQVERSSSRCKKTKYSLLLRHVAPQSAWALATVNTRLL